MDEIANSFGRQWRDESGGAAGADLAQDGEALDLGAVVEPGLEPIDALFDELLAGSDAMLAEVVEAPAAAGQGEARFLPEDPLPEPEEADWAAATAQEDGAGAELPAPAGPLVLEEPAGLSWEQAEEGLAGSAGAEVAAEDPAEAAAPVTGTFELQPVEPEPVDDATQDFAEPIEEVLAELAAIVARRGAARAAETRSPETPLRPALPPQPRLEEVMGRLEAALRHAPALPAAVEAAPVGRRQYSQLDDYVVFVLGGTEYALPVRDVAEIGRMPAVTRVPNVPEFVRGLTNLRGEVVPLLLLSRLLGRQGAEPLPGRVLFLQAQAVGAVVGLVVDEVKGIERIESQQPESVPARGGEKLAALAGVQGRDGRQLQVLDAGRLFRLEDLLRRVG